MIWDERTYLLVDNELIESETNTSMVRDEAFKHPANPIVDENHRELFLGEEGYRIWVRCICRDGGRWRMWYSLDLAHEMKTQAADAKPTRLAYAESDDGIDWKPTRVGSQKNNLLPLGRRPNLGLGGLLHDPADKRHPYKAVILRKGKLADVNSALRAKYPAANNRWYHPPDAGWFVWGIARSNDGFAWELPKHKHNLVDALIEEPAVYRALDGGLVISNQMHSKVSDISWRKIKGWVTYDGVTSQRIPDYIFALPDHMVMVQPIFTHSQTWANTPWVQSHVELVPARKGPTMIALHGYLYGAIGCETYAQTAEIGLASSSTGYWFQQVWPFRPFLRRGNMGEWDCGLVRQAALVDAADKTHIYYGASSVGNGPGCYFRLGCATVGRDRYGYRVLRVYRDYAQPKERRGTITLKPVTLPVQPEITINVSHVTPQRTVRVAILDEHGQPVPGFTFANCRPITEEGVRQVVKWKGKDLARLAGKTVKLQLELYSPDCRFADQHSPRVYAVTI